MKALILTLCLAIFAPAALACSCLPNPPVPDALKQAHVVFLGKVVAIKNHSEHQNRVDFKVETHFKGEGDTVFTGKHGASCGYGFKVGERYVVYAFKADGQLHASLCTRTKLARVVPKEVEELRSLTKK